ncbi:MAG: hypothetical protein ACNS60_04110 [Candidatus Cyclobacteriaceae bacterium M2_1C_046]
MKFIQKNFLYTLLIIFTSACVANYASLTTFNKLPSPEEQCKILAKKRTETKPKRKIPRRIKNSEETTTNTSKKTNFHIDAGEPQHPVSDINLNEVLSTSDITFKPAEDPIHPKYRKKEEAEAKVFKVNPVIAAEEETKTPSFTFKADSSFEYDAIPAILGISGILSLIGLGIFQKQSKMISDWGVQNPWTTRILLTGAHLATAYCCVTIGNQMASEGVFFSENFRNTALIIGGASVLLYPMRKSDIKIFQGSYMTRKIHDLALFASGAALVLSFSNAYKPADSYLKFVPETQITASNSETVYTNVFTDPKQGEPKKGMKTWEKVVLTVLAVAVFVVLGFGVGALACTIACNGSEALALIVFNVGLAGLILLLITALKGIFNRPWKKKEDVQAEPAV